MPRFVLAAIKPMTRPCGRSFQSLDAPNIFSKLVGALNLLDLASGKRLHTVATTTMAIYGGFTREYLDFS